MRKILAIALVLLPALPAFAARTLALSTVIAKKTTKLKSTEASITVRAPKGSKLSVALGASSTVYVPISGKLNAAKTKLLFKLEAGKYYASPDDALFSIKD